MKKIAIVEDDRALSDELKILLDNNGFCSYQIFDFSNAAQKILEYSPNLLLLDIILPETNGQSILKELRKVSDIPIIMLTSKNTDVDEIMSMTYGADDYITKPYNPTLLLLRIEAVFKRMEKQGKQENQELLTYQELTINLLRSSILFHEKEIILSRNEINILYCLLQNQGKIVSRDDLMDFLWDYNEFVDDNTLTVNINRLRKRLEELGLTNIIQTRRKQGYILL